MKVLISGGGIDGLATALSLHEAGIDTEVFEQARKTANSVSESMCWIGGRKHGGAAEMALKDDEGIHLRDTGGCGNGRPGRFDVFRGLGLDFDKQVHAARHGVDLRQERNFHEVRSDLKTARSRFQLDEEMRGLPSFRRRSFNDGETDNRSRFLELRQPFLSCASRQVELARQRHDRHPSIPAQERQKSLVFVVHGGVRRTLHSVGTSGVMLSETGTSIGENMAG